ncbi:LLM class F420-dependent oxidoreductase [Quadrisphaera sp. GCM10027208]|uniref:LLM class F420-dependent oxidoreductase n=1 Tax=Quadrisphaera sp. GCM10027208 TaxID=3273423 RepID=UPI00360CDBC1
MDLRIFTEPQQGATYDDLLAVARTAEDAGFDGFFRSDHYLAMGRDGLPGPTDAWTSLAGLARETSRLRLGTLVTSATFRAPGVLAVQVAQVDQMSGGRVELGLGAGWFEAEHRAYGIEFPDVRERFDRFAEQLELITGLWSTPVGERYSFSGEHYTISDSPALPKPVQPRVPIIIGGSGKRRTPALTARYATEFNANFTSVEQTAVQYERVRAACGQAGRDPGELTWSVALAVVLGATDAEVRRRADAIGRDVAELRANHLAGTPDEVVDRLGRYAEVGCTRVYLQVLDLADLRHLEEIAGSVLPQVA